MGFISVEQFNDERYHNMFKLMDDGDFADVIFLYRSRKDLLVGDVHYIKTPTYSGYTHCLGDGCPVCAIKKADGTNLIRKQTKIFMPVYNINKIDPATGDAGVVEFWDRNFNNGFIAQLDREIFNIYANPSEYVFRIKRKGAFNDTQTRYSFVAVGKNSIATYDQILAKFQIKMPDHYESIVKSFTSVELSQMLQMQQNASAAAVTQDYVPIPRTGYQSSIPDTYVNAADMLGTTNLDVPEDMATSFDTDIVPDIDNDPILSQFDDVDSEGDDLPDPNF